MAGNFYTAAGTNFYGDGSAGQIMQQQPPALGDWRGAPAGGGAWADSYSNGSMGLPGMTPTDGSSLVRNQYNAQVLDSAPGLEAMASPNFAAQYNAGQPGWQGVNGGTGENRPLPNVGTYANPGSNLGMGQQGGWMGTAIGMGGSNGQAPNMGGSPFGNGSSPGQRNPYLSAQADDIGRRTQQGLGQAFNGIRSNAVGVGGLGGSRQGVAQGVATGNAMDSMQGQLAGLYGASYQFDQGNDTQRRGQDLSYDLGNTGQRNSFYTQNRQLDQSGMALGADLYSKGINGEWSPLRQANDIYTPFAGNGTTTQNSGSDSNWQNAIGTGLGIWGTGLNNGWWGK